MVIKCCTAEVRNSKKRHFQGICSAFGRVGQHVVSQRGGPGRGPQSTHQLAFNCRESQQNRATKQLRTCIGRACVDVSGFHQQRPDASGARCTGSFFGGRPPPSSVSPLAQARGRRDAAAPAALSCAGLDHTSAAARSGRPAAPHGDARRGGWLWPTGASPERACPPS